MCETGDLTTVPVCVKLVAGYSFCMCEIGSQDTVSVYVILVARTQYLYVCVKLKPDKNTCMCV